MIKELNKNPGPGIYDNKSQLSGPKFGFGSSNRMPIKNGGTPGPGTYKMPVQVGNVASYNMPNRDPNFKFS